MVVNIVFTQHRLHFFHHLLLILLAILCQLVCFLRLIISAFLPTSIRYTLFSYLPPFLQQCLIFLVNSISLIIIHISSQILLNMVYLLFQDLRIIHQTRISHTFPKTLVHYFLIILFLNFLRLLFNHFHEFLHFHYMFFLFQNPNRIPQTLITHFLITSLGLLSLQIINLANLPSLFQLQTLLILPQIF